MEIEKYIVNKNMDLLSALKKMDEGGEKVLFVTDEHNILFGALTDGNIRRWILNRGELSERVEKICNKNPISVNENEFTTEYIKELMTETLINAIPVINKSRKIVDVLFWHNILSNKKKEVHNKIESSVVIMAGGKGTRMVPFTQILPKPLIPIGEKPIIEIILDEYAKYGIVDYYISINYKGKLIKAYFEDHKDYQRIKYIEEDKPLGTAGALKFLEGKVKDPFFVSNCDIIINHDYSEIFNFHINGKFDITLVASLKQHIIPYGVCEIIQGGILNRIEEKPQYNYLVNTGMYILNPDVLQYIPENEFFHITHLITCLQERNKRIGVFPVSENSWLDIGQWDEYKKVIEKFKF